MVKHPSPDAYSYSVSSLGDYASVTVHCLYISFAIYHLVYTWSKPYRWEPSEEFATLAKRDPTPNETTPRSKEANTRHVGPFMRIRWPKPQGNNVLLDVHNNHFTFSIAEEPGRSTVDAADIPGELDKNTGENPGVSGGTEPSEGLKFSGPVQYQIPASSSYKVLHSKTSRLEVAPKGLVAAQFSLAVGRIVKILCRPRLAKHSHRVEWICVRDYGRSRKRPIPVIRRYANCY